MTTNSEIESEIKLLVEGDPAPLLAPWLAGMGEVLISDSRQLRNTYFDTPDRLLSRLKFGLRTRYGETSGAEQTIKTAGIVVDGLHQRAEYNRPLNDGLSHGLNDGQGRGIPELALFPAEIWPPGTDLAALQQALIPLFTTDFTRQRWLVAFELSAEGGEADSCEAEQCTVEVVYDSGEVRAGIDTGSQSSSQPECEPINELELELKQGPLEALHWLARQLGAVIRCRPGSLSKAARGYALVAKQP